MRSQIYGRQEAIETLKLVEASTESVMVGIFGRRRIGKTYLIDQYFKDEKDYFFIKNLGIKEEQENSQVRSFYADVNERVDKFNTELSAILISKGRESEFVEVVKETLTSDTWEEFFRFLSKTFDNLQVAIDKFGLGLKIVYFFDEVSYVAETVENFANRLGAIWEKNFKDKPNLKFILCASAASWMIKEIINAKGGLNSRCKYKIPLKPFAYKEMLEYLSSKHDITFDNAKESVKVYMCVGGVAKYLDLYAEKKGLLFNQTISELMFSEFRDMRDEFGLLMDSIFKNAIVHKELIYFLSTREKGVSEVEIIENLKANYNEAEIKRCLRELLDCDYLIEMELIRQKGIETVFRLIDEYCRFYFKWIYGQGEENFHANSSYWNNEAHNTKIWFGTSFEVFCFRNKESIKSLLQLTRFNTKFFSFNINVKGGAEGDMVIEASISKQIQGVFIIENKFKEGARYSINESELNSLTNKIVVLKEAKKYAIDPVIIFVTSDGVTENQYFKSLKASSYTIAHLTS